MTLRRIATYWMLLLEAGFVAWGAAAAVMLERLPGPGGRPILAAGYQGFTGASWRTLSAEAPRTADFISLIFRVYGVYNVAFGLLGLAIAATAFRRGEAWAWWALAIGNTLALGGAMTYDRLADAIGPFELSEYVGLAGLFAALAVTAPFRPSPRAAAAPQRP